MTQAAHQIAVAAALAAAAGAAAALRRYAMVTEPSRVEVTHHVVASPELPPGLDGMTICQISDLHIAPSTRNRQEVAAAVRGVRADLYVYTGDMISRGAVAEMLAWIDDLGAAVLPAIAVLGNAEHKPSVSTPEIVAALQARGITVLVNEAVTMTRGGGTLQIVGVDDPHTGFADFARAYAGADPALWTLLLCHSPDGAADMQEARADLMLCGHTHAGQVRLPVIGAVKHNLKRVRRLVGGWYTGEDLARRAGCDIARTRMYVSRGLGAGTPAARVMCRPELPIFELRRAEPADGGGRPSPRSR